MELRHVRYFVAVAEELHFGRAAKRLNMAQPPLSQQIQALERELGVQLFKRNSRRVELTSHGQLFLQEARALLDQARRTEEVMKAAKRGEHGSIIIGFVTSAIYSLLTPTLREFHARYPRVEIRCQVMSPTLQVEALHRGAIDVGFVRTPLADDSLQFHPLLREWLVLALPGDHPAAAKKKVRLKDFAGEPLVIFSKSQGATMHEQIIATCSNAGFNPELMQEGHEMQSMIGLVAAGLGVSLVPSSLQNLRRPDIVYKTLLDKTAEVELSLALRAGAPTPVQCAFVEAALSVATREVSGDGANTYWFPPHRR